MRSDLLPIAYKLNCKKQPDLLAGYAREDFPQTARDCQMRCRSHYFLSPKRLEECVRQWLPLEQIFST
jgi:hypothetical protein